MLSGCGHAGIVNTVRHAQKLTGEDRIAAIIGGFHLSGPMFERIIEPTVDALASWRRRVLFPRTAPGGRPSIESPPLPGRVRSVRVGTTIEL